MKLKKNDFLKMHYIIVITLITTFLFHSNAMSQPYRLAIIPFTFDTIYDLSSLKNEIFDTLFTRLSKKDTVIVISLDDIEKEIDSSENYNSKNKALMIGEKLQADYVISGSLTTAGKNITISLNLIDVSGIMPLQNYNFDIQEPEQVLPQITRFASNISGQILNVETDTQLLSEKKDEEISVKEDTVKILKTDSKPGKTEDIKSSQDDTYFTKEPWTSEILNVGIIGMTLGDVDNDGKTEIVIVTPKMVQTFRYVDGKIIKVADIHKIHFRYPVGIDVADINGNGFEEIFVTALDNYKNAVTSFVLEYDGSKYNIIAKNFNSYFRVVTLMDNTAILLGQKHRRNAPYKGKICKLNWNTSKRTRTRKQGEQDEKSLKTKRNSLKYTPEKQILPPAGVNVLGLAYGKITNKEQNLIAAYDEYNNINVINNTGEKIWESREKYSGNTLYYQIDEGTSTDKKRKFLPVRIVINDINRDGVNDLIAVKNYEIARNILGSFKFYNKHHIEILTWDGVSLVTKFKTGIIYGFVRDFTIGDLDNDGKDELIVAVIKREGKTIFAKPKSFLRVYKLK